MPVKGTKRAIAVADISVIDISINQIGHLRLGMMPPFYRLGQQSQLQQLSLFIQQMRLLPVKVIRSMRPRRSSSPTRSARSTTTEIG